MFSGRHRRRGREHGFSLVEIMIAMVIGLLGILVIMQVFLVSEGQKRTTTGGADAQENALMALFAMERDLRMAGLGLTGSGCTTINAYNATMTPTTFPISLAPVTIAQYPSNTTRDAAGNLVPAAGTDMITVLYSASAFGNIPTTITSAMPDSSAILNAANGDGFIQNDLVLISAPPPSTTPCSLVQASQDGQQTGATWNLQHNPGGAFVWNPPGGQNIFPAGGYGAGATLTNMGVMVNHEYYVQNNNLMLRDVNPPSPPPNPPITVALVNGIIAIRAQYGRDTNADGYVDVYDNTAPTSATNVVAIRLAVVARSVQLEKDDVSPATLDLWPGATIPNPDRKYRYKIYQTTIPLRNVIWNTGP